MSNNRNLLFSAVRYALAAGFVVGAPQAFAQDDDAAELDRIEVTGSRIKRVDIETTTPVTVIDREMIEMQGDSTVAELLRNSTFNSFGSFRDQSGFGAGFSGTSQVSLRGLGSARTLVLVDGKRFATTPGSGAAAANLNLIPLDAVERIEILRDGASAIYGSDAIAGVVNVITRRDMEGASFTIFAEDPNVPGGEAQRYSLAGGMSGNKGNVTIGVEHFERDAVFDRDIPEFAVAPDSFGISSFGFPGSYIVLGGDLAGANFVDPRCPLNVGDSSQFPNSYRWSLAFATAGTSSFGSERCGYNFAADTKLFGDSERDSLFLNGNYEISNDLMFTSRAIVANNDHNTRFAGAPVTTPFPIIGADNPNNPINLLIADGNATTADLAPALVLMRTVPNGFRDSLIRDKMVDLYGGLSGVVDVFNGMDWEVGFQYIDLNTDHFTYNLANKRSIQAAIDDGSLDLFNVQGLDHATWLASTNATLQAFNHTGIYQGETDYMLWDAQASWDLFDMPAGVVPFVIGVERYELDFSQVNDPESNQLIIAGTSGGDNISGVGRTVNTLFAEAVFPLLDTVELDVAVRYDDYSDFGSTTNPKLSIGWRPNDDLLVRASWGEGFRAPAMDELYGNVSESFPPAIDLVGCANGVASCNPTQYRVFFGGNPNLGPEESEAYTAGVVWNPIDDFSMEVSYYDIEFTDQIDTVSLQRMFQLEQDGFTNTVVRNAQGQVDFVSLQFTNLSGVQTDGIDVITRYGYDAGDFGRFNAVLDISHVLGYSDEGAPGDGFVERAGDTGLPDMRGMLTVGWALGDWEASWVTNYIAANGDGDDRDTFGDHNSSYVWHDLQVGYNLPWDGEITLGARNVFDAFPPRNELFYGWQPVDISLYDPQGRIAYVQYRHQF